MSRVAAPVADGKTTRAPRGTSGIYVLSTQITAEFNKAVGAWVATHEVTKTSVIRHYVAEGIEYVPTNADDTRFISAKEASEVAGEKRSAAFGQVKSKANLFDELRSKLASGELSPEELAQLFLAAK